MPEQLYRESLKEKLLDLAGELKTGRGSFSVGSGRYRSLDNAISSVVKLLDQHEHEEVLSQEDRVKLETEIQKMKKAALNYRNYKLSQVALSDRGVATASVEQRIRVDRIRYQAADDILKIDTKIPKNPGEEQGIVPPDQLEPGDRPQTDWRLKWKQNTRYLAKKQLKAFEHKLAAFNAGKDPEQLKPDQEDFDLLMDMVGKQLLAYKNDAHLCKKYPKMRLDMERAIRTSEKLKNLTEDEFATYIFNWLSNSTKKAVAAAKRAKNRKGLPFTEADEEKAVKDHEEIIQEKIANFGTKEKLETAGDVLTQMARFADLKMQMISDKQYVQLMHTNKLGHTFSVVDYERLVKSSKTKEEKKFYRILRDIRELEDAGIKHIKPAYAIEKAVYKKITETDHRTFKRDFFNFTSTRVGAKAATVKHIMKNLPSIEGNTSAMAVDQNNKFRVGKVGLQLHSRHKNVQLSGGMAFGQARVSTTIGTCLSKPGAQMSLLADATAVRARIKTKASMFKGDVKASLGAGVNVGYASALFSGGVGNITVKDAEGNEKTAFGVSGKVGAVAAIAKGDVGCTFNFFGFKISASLTGYGGAIGTEYGGELTTGGASLTLGGALGIGATLKVSIDWSEAWGKLKTKWANSRLMNLINNYKAKKAAVAKKAEKEAKDLEKALKEGKVKPKNKENQKNDGLILKERDENHGNLILGDEEDDLLVGDEDRKSGNIILDEKDRMPGNQISASRDRMPGNRIFNDQNPGPGKQILGNVDQSKPGVKDQSGNQQDSNQKSEKDNVVINELGTGFGLGK